MIKKIKVSNNLLEGLHLMVNFCEETVTSANFYIKNLKR
jgi:hypothetical protein